VTVGPIHCGLFRMSLASKGNSLPRPASRQRIQQRHRSCVANMGFLRVTFLDPPPRGVRYYNTRRCRTAIVSISLPSTSMKCSHDEPHYFSVVLPSSFTKEIIGADIMSVWCSFQFVVTCLCLLYTVIILYGTERTNHQPAAINRSHFLIVAVLCSCLA
jgi:hypothetical protein